MGDWLFGGGAARPPVNPGKVVHGPSTASGELDTPHVLDVCRVLTGAHEMAATMRTCPHGGGEATCLKCFHEKQARRATEKAKPRPDIPRSYVQVPQGPNSAIIEEVKRANRAAGPAGPVHMGTLPSGQPVAPPAAPKPKGKYPVPVHRAPGDAGTGAARAMPEPFDYASNPGRTSSDGTWHPPKHESLIDRLPRHPNPDGVVPGKGG